MVQIAPSILAGNFANLEEDIRQIEKSGADLVHVDVMDGLFVPNITVGIPVVKALRRVTSLPLDVHLMIDRPIRYAEEFIKAGADCLTVHLEADTPGNVGRALETIRALGCKAGLSLKPGTAAEEAVPFLELCDLILVMTVEPGFGGQRFRPEQMEKLKTLRRLLEERSLNCLLEVDGGVDETTCRLCRDSGADILVTGSAFFKAPNKAALVAALKA